MTAKKNKSIIEKFESKGQNLSATPATIQFNIIYFYLNNVKRGITLCRKGGQLFYAAESL